MNQLIRQATLVLPDHIIQNGDISIVNGRIGAIGMNLPPITNGPTASFDGDIVIPGLIDTHVHGAGGADVMDSTYQSLTVLRQTLLKEGTTAFLATTMSSPLKRLQAVLDNIQAAKKSPSKPVQAELLGVHLEGPWLAPKYQGAHKGDCIPPEIPGHDLTDIMNLAETYPDLIRIITLAVERPDTAAIAAFCQSKGIIPSAGHTGADYQAMARAAASGIRRITHSFNAMPGIHHRQPGPMTEGLLNPNLELEFIADSVHIHPAILEMAIRLKPPDKITLISDGTRAVGMPNGEYELGGQNTIVENGIARLADGTIAGSAYPLLQGLRTLVQKLGRPLYEAVRLTSLNPAQTLKVADRLGSLETGKEATFVRLKGNLTVKEVWVQGNKVV